MLPDIKISVRRARLSCAIRCSSGLRLAFVATDRFRVVCIPGFRAGVRIDAEWLGEVLDREPLGRWVDSRTAEHRFSGTRVLYQLIKSLAFLGTVGGIAWAVYHRIPGLAHFLQENFGPMSSP